ncbi:pentapeptide repeat-containing protein [Nocardia sp. XZ_19_385]|uniref:pentapeptide repeat-containing protein n=1 Tax=Nocardia sp. XZ_19_385 TaxID=2769488 RepID=UPI00188E1647|nr:pentapeptide repeat-containing protein [Nocardia sp. XZ_19_385]
MFGWERARPAPGQTRIGKSNRAIRRWAERFGLLPAILSALVAGIFIAYVAYQVVSRYTPTSQAAAAPIDITKVALTIVAGVGGVVALVIAYRRQRDAEQSRFVERFGAAAAQLGATDAAVRIAGVYAMAGTADEADGLRRQQCIDVLCGYLRLPYSPELGGNHQTKHVQKRTTGGDTGEDEDHFEYRQNDREVRATIIRVIADHLRAEAEYSWSASQFDFRTAYLEDVNLSRAIFAGAARFDEATFSGDAWFDKAQFTGTAGFDNATFAGTAWFGEVAFRGDAAFNKSVFSGIAGFDKATFGGTAWFGAATFGGDAGFGAATFSGNARFGGTTFRGDAGFGGATISGDTWFDNATFGGDAGFGGATFGGAARFDDATFGGDAGFGGATFGGAARFGEATFSGDAWFNTATFKGAAVFARFAFAGRTSFMAADFGSEPIVFTQPRQWGPPPPEFDWGNDGVGKPANVEPRVWPPVVSAP